MEGLVRLDSVRANVTLRDNDALTDIRALSSLRSTITVVIAENVALSACNCGLYEALSGDEAFEVVLYNNAPGCNSKAEVLAAGACPAVAVEGGASLPEAFAIEQNYPNPFNPATAIPFTVPRRGEVTLKVHDVLGREVAVLASGVYPAGRHEVTWDATGFPSGVYVYRLAADGVALSRKLIVHK